MLDIDHPELFSTFDYSFKFTPQFASSSWEFKNAGQEFYTKANVIGLTYDAIFTAHTLIGQLQFSLGLGALFGRTRNDFDSDLSSSLVFSSKFSYIVFISKNFFTNVSAGRYETKNSFLNGVQHINYTNVQIGYYFPELRSILRRVF